VDLPGMDVVRCWASTPADCVYARVQTACPIGGICGALFDKFLFSEETTVAIAGSPIKGVQAQEKADENANVPHHRLEEEDGPAQI
jgi:hypothetical protein